MPRWQLIKFVVTCVFQTYHTGPRSFCWGQETGMVECAFNMGHLFWFSHFPGFSEPGGSELNLPSGSAQKAPLFLPSTFLL